MNVISNSSPLIALSRINRLSVLKKLFGKIYIPDMVYKETVLQSNNSIQKENIQKAIEDNFITVEIPISNHSFSRTIDLGERGVLNLAFDKRAALLLVDDKKARKEANELGFKVIKTSTLLKYAAKRKFITSYEKLVKELENLQIYLPK